MKDGPKEYVLTDEGDINKIFGIEKKNLLKTSWNYHNHS